MTYQQPPPPQYVVMQRPPSNGKAIGGMVLGIIAIAVGIWSLIPLLGLFAAILGFVPSIIAILLGHMGLSESVKLGGIGKAQAVTGLTLGWVTLGIIVLTTVFWMAAIGSR